MASVVCIHAHPDDAEILAGGTLALLSRAGHEITIVSMTPGDCGSTLYGAEEIAAMRRSEASNAAAAIGARYECAEFRDLAIFNDDKSRRRVTELLRRVRPELEVASVPLLAQRPQHAAGDGAEVLEEAVGDLEVGVLRRLRVLGAGGEADGDAALREVEREDALEGGVRLGRHGGGARHLGADG